MLIVCPNCATSYRVAGGTLGETGRSVRCVTCHHVWFEEAREPEPETTGFSAHTYGAPEIAARPPIRPPLNDVVDIGDASYSRSDAGEAAEGDGGHFDEPQNLYPGTEPSEMGP
ncbi:MAG: zinc-ribbon domain-containing protein, partial [Pseudorhodoplanes sp.]